jgi:hypothetical protein
MPHDSKKTRHRHPASGPVTTPRCAAVLPLAAMAPEIKLSSPAGSVWWDLSFAFGRRGTFCVGLLGHRETEDVFIARAGVGR